MSMGRVCLLTGTFVDSQQNPLANGVLTWELVINNPGGAPVVYQVTADPANGEFVLPISFTTPLDGSGTLGAGVPVTAPQDLQLNIAGVLTPTTAYYLITGPDGISFTTTNFAYSGTARDIGTVSSNSAPVTYTQAAVTFRVATPQELGVSVQVVATLSDQCTLTGFDGVLILPGTQFTAQLDGAGVGTLLLAPNDPAHGGITVPVDPSRTSANVVWWISVNGGPAFPIQVPAAGGYIDDLIVGIDGQGNVVPVSLLTKVTVTSNFTLTAATDIVFANAASGNIVVTLPDAVVTVKDFWIYKIDGTAHTVTLQTVSGQTINGVGTLVIGTQWQAASPVSDTANWVSALSGTGGGSLELTDGLTDLTGVTKIIASGMIVGGTAGAATLTVPPTLTNPMDAIDDLIIGGPGGLPVRLPSDNTPGHGLIQDPITGHLTWGPVGGTVTSIAVTVPADETVSGGPITTSGTLAITRNNQTQNTFLAGPTTGSPATPAYRTLVPLDLPIASTSHIGGSKADGTTITVDPDGTYHAAASGSSLASLSDVNISSPHDGQQLRYSASDSKWHNFDPTAPGGGVGWSVLTDAGGNLITTADGSAIAVPFTV